MLTMIIVLLPYLKKASKNERLIVVLVFAVKSFVASHRDVPLNSQVYSEPCCTSKMERFAIAVNSLSASVALI